MGLCDDEVDATQPIRHYFHDLDGEQRGFLNKKKKASLIDSLYGAISSRNG